MDVKSTQRSWLQVVCDRERFGLNPDLAWGQNCSVQRRAAMRLPLQRWQLKQSLQPTCLADAMTGRVAHTRWCPMPAGRGCRALAAVWLPRPERTPPASHRHASEMSLLIGLIRSGRLRCLTCDVATNRLQVKSEDRFRCWRRSVGVTSCVRGRDRRTL